jgi:DNA adenine methylase
MSYQDYEYQDGDIVYCDPPYENTTRYNNQDFDSKAFYEWVKTRPYQVWFSSYEISDDSFYKEKIFSLRKIMSNVQDKKSYANEYLYSNKKI